MGKKSKKKKAKPTPSTSNNTPEASDASGECWICLDGGPDDAGQPLVRDCSCRGVSAGFAHLSCLVEYAEQKCDGNVVSTIDPSWTEPFKVCPNCKQEYRSKLAIDLATACVDFVERKKPDCLWRRALALQMKLGANVVYGEYSAGKVEECGRMEEECLSVINQLKSNPYGSLMSILEGDVYMLLGCLHLERGNESGGRKAVEYYEKAKEIDGQGAFASADMRILEAKALFERGEGDDEEEDLAENVKSVQLYFQEMVKVHGEGSPEAIIHGRKLVAALKDVHRAVEAERLMTKIYTWAPSPRSRSYHDESF
ncbi:hypothetical protein ACHAXT_001652 [Thalassiosira profunda]